DHVPHKLLRETRSRGAVVVARGEDDFESPSIQGAREVLMATSGSSIADIDPRLLAPSKDLDLSALEARRVAEGVHSITLMISKLDEDLMLEATRSLTYRYRALSELRALEEFAKTVYVVYVVTHSNPKQRPFGPLTVNIGGDCYRTGDQIRDLSSILDRTKQLAEAMLRKAVMIFPDIPALHGGKKGEWIVLDEEGKKIDGLSEEAIISLGSSIIPRGIRFLNRYKEQQAVAAGIFGAFPEKDYIFPDSGSPDVLSGTFWRGENPNKYINMCEAWNARGVDMRSFTCLPPDLGGTLDPSSRPTGFGVATTTIELADNHPNLGRNSRSKLRFILEAAGGVGDSTIEALVEMHGINPNNITVFDKSAEACSSIRGKYGVKTTTVRHTDFYERRLRRAVEDDGVGYDVWINNGEGNNTKPEHVAELIHAGVRVFTGGANNYLEVATQKKSLDLISAAGGWAWPDAATSGGGWTLAVIDILTRCQGRKSNTKEIQREILDIVAQRNRQLVRDVLEGLPAGASGKEVWERVDSLMSERAERTLGRRLSPQQIFEGADTSTWNLV
ncbi:MAG: hypothetical protein KDD47_15675, partial [Acidobacteria bacterium]|nr:hypothetical protein [Acidobacteriota bacterium]